MYLNCDLIVKHLEIEVVINPVRVNRKPVRIKEFSKNDTISEFSEFC